MAGNRGKTGTGRPARTGGKVVAVRQCPGLRVGNGE